MIRVSYKGEVKELYIEQILAMILTKLKEYAEVYLGQAVVEVVITIPAGFNFFQRQAIKDAAVIAGLSVLWLLMEPTAVALAYNCEKNIHEERIVLSFDCGGGCTNVSILVIEDGIFENKSVACDTHLGGEDFVGCLLMYFINEFKRKYKRDLSASNRSIFQLRKACEETKRTLSFEDEACIELESLFEGISFCTKITQTKFEEICADLFARIMELVQKAISDSKQTKSDIEEVIVVGGSSRIPKIKKLLQNFFGDKNWSIPLNTDEAIAYGGAIKAAILSGVCHPLTDDLLVLPILGISIGIETASGVMDIIFKRNTTIPCKRSCKFTLRNTGGALWFEQIRGVLEANEDLCKMEPDTDIVIPICILEGESDKVAENTVIDKFDFTVIRTKSPRKLELEIDFDIYRDRNIFITVTEIGNDASKMQRTVGKNKFSGEEIESMIKDSEKLNRDFVVQKATITTRNDFEKYAFSVKSQMKDTEQFCQRVSANCNKVIDRLDNATHLDMQEIECYRNELEEMCGPITENTELKSENTELKSENTELKSENTELKSENTELKSSKRILTERLETSETNARNFASRLAQAEARCQELEARLSQELQPFWVVVRAEIHMTEEEIGRGGWGAIKVANSVARKWLPKCFTTRSSPPTIFVSSLEK